MPKPLKADTHFDPLIAFTGLYAKKKLCVTGSGVNACNLSYSETVVEGLQVQGLPTLLSEFQVTLGNEVKASLKMKEESKKKTGNTLQYVK